MIRKLYLHAEVPTKGVMSKKKVHPSNGIVFSTDPKFKIAQEELPAKEDLTPAQQKLKLRLDTKQRAGKAVTIVEGFVGREANLEELGKN